MSHRLAGHQKYKAIGNKKDPTKIISLIKKENYMIIAAEPTFVAP